MVPKTANPVDQTSGMRSSPSPATHGRRFKRRKVKLADGGRLDLNTDGSIALVDGAGIIMQSWAPADQEWARHAIRFGLYPHGETIAPDGRSVAGTKPPRG